MKTLLSILIFLAACNIAQAQVTLKVTSIPANTPAGAVIYVAGSFNGWDPSATPMMADGAGNYTYTIAESAGTVEYKFTRGSWPTVEGNAEGKYLPNRKFTFTGTPQTISVTVLTWEDTGAGSTSTAASNVQIMNTAFYMPQLNRSRKIWLYLPPDYQTETKTYPVIYLHDGQNLFDNATSFAGEWQVDETLNRLFGEGDYGAIVVGIDNGGNERINEYTPWNNTQYGGGDGDNYVQFVAETLKPYIDANYRTKPEAEYTALIGSSLGALISTYGGLKYADVFSKIGSFSPAYWIVSTQLNAYINAIEKKLSDMRIYFVAGATESATMASEINTAKNNLQSKGLTTDNTLVKLDTYGQHNENYWKGEFAAAYLWLFKNTRLNTNDIQAEKISVRFEKNQLHVKGTSQNTKASIYDTSGKLIEALIINNGPNTLKNKLPEGNFILKTDYDSIQFQAR